MKEIEKLAPLTPELHLGEIEETRNSYIRKEEFIEIIKNLPFDTVRNADITFNTGYKWDTENECVKTYRYTITLD